MPDNYALVADAATQTGYSREYVRKLARQGDIKSKKVGIVVLVHLPELLEHKRKQDAARAAQKAGDESK